MRCPLLAELPQSKQSHTGWPWTEESQRIPDITPKGMSWPVISIVTPSFNQGLYLEETIRSVLLQGYPNVEYIVIDGGSTDNSVEIIKKYEPWISFWESKPDHGQSHAINKGFEFSNGDIMAWINSDDVYDRGAFHTVALQLVDQQKAMLVGSSIITDGPNSRTGTEDRRKLKFEEMLYEGRSFQQPSVFWTRDLWAISGLLDQKLFYNMDYDLWLRMMIHGNQTIFVNKLLSYARSHRHQKTRFKNDNEKIIHYQEKAYAALKATREMKKHPITWLSQSYARRFRQAIKSRNWYRLRGSQMQHAAIQLLLHSEIIQ